MRIVIDGNIGSGKSTQLDLLKSKGFKIFKEPIDDWPLELFYSDKSRWGFLLQMKILSSFADAPDDHVFERSMLSSRDVFWWNLHANGIVTDAENEIYKEWYKKVAWRPTVTIYLSSKPEKCYERISTRNQDGDGGVTLKYLQDIHMYYQIMGYRNSRMWSDSRFHRIYIEGKTPEQIHEEILSVLKVENAMQLSDSYRSEVS
jgi:deoxyadenosine/deoxycytidine kinase